MSVRIRETNYLPCTTEIVTMGHSKMFTNSGGEQTNTIKERAEYINNNWEKNVFKDSHVKT